MNPQSFAGSSPTDPAEAAMQELESDRTAALTRMHPEEVGVELATTDAGNQALADRADELAALGEGPAEPQIDHQVRINSIENSLDGGVATFQGEIQIEEFLNNEFVSRITVIVSLGGDETTSIAEVEAALLAQALDSMRIACRLDPEDLMTSLRRTRRDEDVAGSD
jgi:hypothetical protein